MVRLHKLAEKIILIEIEWLVLSHPAPGDVMLQHWEFSVLGLWKHLMTTL